MINNIITVLNSRLPDAVISIDNVQTDCNERDITVSYTVTNQGSEILPQGVFISFFGDDIPTGATIIDTAIPMGESIMGTANITIIDEIPEQFTLTAIVDEPAVIPETNEDNNASNEVPVNIDGLTINEIENLQLCDDESNDSLVIFDVQQAAVQAIAGQTGISFEFYLTQQDAANQVNPIPNPETFQNNTSPQTLYIRFFLNADLDCFTIVPLELEVSFQPTAPEIAPLQVCDDSLDNDMVASFNLTQQDASIINNQSQVLLSYHTTLEDAEIGVNAIAFPESYTNTSNPQVIYVRLVNEVNPECYDIGFFDLIINPVADVVTLPSLLACNEGFDIGTFDLTEVGEDTASTNEAIIGYYTNLDDAQALINPISDPTVFQNTTNPQTIYVRIQGDDILDCFEIAQFSLEIENCPPFVPDGFSPNEDGINDTFEISRLKDVFEDYQLLIYSRLGNLIYEGDNDIPFWDGTPNQGIGGTEAPTGVYYWVLQLNDSQFNDRVGWVYLNR